MNTSVHFYHISLSSVRIRNYSDKHCREFRSTISYSKTFLPIPSLSRHNVEKFCTSREAPDDKIENAHCMLDNLGHKHNLSLWNVYCFSTANIFGETHTNTSRYWGSIDEERSETRIQHYCNLHCGDEYMCS
jgi:hypothetical protein